MEHLTCDFGSACYPFYLGADCHNELVDRLGLIGADRYFVITHGSLVSLGAGTLARALDRFAPAHVLLHPEGEVGKRLSSVEDLIESAIRHGATRRSCIVAFGGGVTGNVAGMVAALAFRGLPLVHVPTTLLAMLDSVISLKQAVNASFGKNLIGAYYAPAMVLADTAYLRTVSAAHLRWGLAEVVKNALAIAPAQIPRLERILDGPLDDAALHALVRMGLDAKVSVMHDDAREKRRGLVLEYGHTIGHAIEHASHGRTSHGEAVALGMRAAAEIARSLTHLSDDDAAAHHRLIGRLNIARCLPNRVTEADVLRTITHDNKRGYLPHRPGAAAMVLLESLGRPHATDGLPLTYVPTALIERGVATLRQTAPVEAL
ncbi:MAG: 2-deoxy-scyllo-inosose synthase [Vicinamibacterales bacterium]